MFNHKGPYKIIGQFDDRVKENGLTAEEVIAFALQKPETLYDIIDLSTNKRVRLVEWIEEYHLYGCDKTGE